MNPRFPLYIVLARMKAQEEAMLEAKPQIGDLVDVERDLGAIERRRVRLEPWQVGDGTWLIGLDGITGGFMLGRCTMVRR